jgi:hypothetical protein
VHSYGDALFADSAVYDPLGKRMLVLLSPVPSTAREWYEVALWQLSLTGTPEWKRVITFGPSPGSEVQSARLALDAEGQHLYAVGGSLERSGVWSLSLGSTPTWTRVADAPEQPGTFYVDASLVFDPTRRSLVFFGGHSRPGKIWSLSLETATWTLLDEGNDASMSYGVTTVLDRDHDRVVIFGGDISSSLASYSLATGEWALTDVLGYESHVEASGVLDSARGRILYFGGVPASPGPGNLPNNAVSALALDTLTLSELVPATRYAPLQMAARKFVWDPERAAVVAYGSGETWLHGVSASDGWTPFTDVGWTTPPFSSGIYDLDSRAIIAFGRHNSRESYALARLSSAPQATWETLDAGPGPIESSTYGAVYDSAQRRVVIYGGQPDTSYPPSFEIDDVWALSLSGSLAWSKLEPSGASPGRMRSPLGIYDSEGRRLLIYGAADGQARQKQNLWSLSLDDAPHWTELAPTGAAPVLDGRWASAVYDPAGQRMIVVNFTDPGPAHGGPAHVFALDLSTLAWHEFCSVGITPALTMLESSTGNVVLVPDGLFLTVSGGSFRFDLETSYCD